MNTTPCTHPHAYMYVDRSGVSVVDNHLADLQAMGPAWTPDLHIHGPLS